MIRIGVVGATGYTGVELMRLLAAHPAAELTVVTSREQAGRPVAEQSQNLRGHIDLRYTAPEDAQLTACDVVFFATPNGTAMTMAGALIAAGVRVIDLSSDFRLRDPVEWRRWHDAEHASPELLDEAVYGLPELHRETIRGARLVANPGCYPTAIQLGFLPLVEQGLVDTTRLIADAKSGVSGAGRRAETGLLFSEAEENFKSYGVSGHRHLPEILQGLAAVSRTQVGITFVPHLTPMIRGLQATLYAMLSGDLGEAELHRIYRARYADEPFVDVMETGVVPETRGVRGSNQCRIAVFRPGGGQTVVVLSVIDNLVKGASGQAVQNLNIMFGLDETTGLEGVALQP